jgi:hypothetical protein
LSASASERPPFAGSPERLTRRMSLSASLHRSKPSCSVISERLEAAACRFSHLHRLRRCDDSRILSPLYVGWRGQAIQDLEVTMKKEIFQENRARWEVLEWMGSTQSKVIWAVAAAIVVLVIIYLLQ